MINWAELFPDEDYRFHMGLRRGAPGEYFRAGAERAELCAERQRWLQQSPSTYSALLPAGEPLLAETIRLAREWNNLSSEQMEQLAGAPNAHDRCVQLGGMWEPDFLLLQADAAGEFQLVGGCVCFPSSWSLAEKIGHPMASIHGPVPGLNASLGRSIDTFLVRLTPGSAWLRQNWGLSRSPERNQHPARLLPRLDATVDPSELWLRVEEQALVALPQSRGVLFTIRIRTEPLAAVRAERDAASRLARALRSMSPEVAAYKGLAAARERIIQLLS